MDVMSDDPDVRALPSAIATWEAFQLPLYSGESELDEWLCKLEAFFDSTGKEEDSQRILYATNYLTGTPHTKWRWVIQQVGEGKMQGVTSWGDFKALLVRLFKPDTPAAPHICDTTNKPDTPVTPHAATNNRDSQSSALRQGKLSVADYTQRFLDSHNLQRYVAGLNPGIAAHLNSNRPKNLQEAISLALDAEFRGASAKNKPSSPLSPSNDVYSSKGGKTSLGSKKNKDS